MDRHDDLSTWTDEHDRLLAEAAPRLAEPSDADVERVWARVAAEVAVAAAPVRRRRRLGVGAAAGVTAAVLSTTGIAAAGIFTARTGEGPVDAEDLSLGGPGERLALAAPDYGDVVAEETEDIPFPDDEARDLAVRDQVHDARHAGADEFVSTGAVRAWVADAALCSWSNQWAAATRTGDLAARDEAVEAIRSAPRWPAVVALDPAPYTRDERVVSTDSDGRTTVHRYRDDSQFSYLAALGEAVTGRDVAAVADLLAEHNGQCRAAAVPDLPGADPLHGED